MRSRKSGFTLIELLVVMVILGILVTLGLGSFRTSQMKARDSKRKGELRQVTIALEAYYNDRGTYPADDGNGNILGCGADASEACSWGSSVFSNTSVTPNTVYMTLLPEEPTSGQTYFYDFNGAIGSGGAYQIYARLENTLDVDVPKSGGASPVPQTYDATDCGPGECNYGISSSNTTVEAGHSPS